MNYKRVNLLNRQKKREKGGEDREGFFDPAAEQKPAVDEEPEEAAEGEEEEQRDNEESRQNDANNAKTPLLDGGGGDGSRLHFQRLRRRLRTHLAKSELTASPLWICFAN